MKVTPALVSTPIMTTGVLISNNGNVLQMPIVHSTTTTTSTSLLIMSNNPKNDDTMKNKVIPGKMPIPALKSKKVLKKKITAKKMKLKSKIEKPAKKVKTKTKEKKMEKNKTVPDSGEPETKKTKIEENLVIPNSEESTKLCNSKIPEPLNLNPTDLANDIFESYQAVTENETNHESLSPTAAYLMTFPLVAPPGGKNAENSIQDENETVNLIQNNGVIEKNKNINTEDRDLSENANLILDNFSSFFANSLYPNPIDPEIATASIVAPPLKSLPDSVISFVPDNDCRFQKIVPTSSYQSIDTMIDTKSTPIANYHRPYTTYSSASSVTTTNVSSTKVTVTTNSSTAGAGIFSQSYDSMRSQNVAEPNFTFSLCSKSTPTYTDNFNNLNLPRTTETTIKPIAEFTFSLSNTTNTQSARTTMQAYYPSTSINSNSSYNFLPTTMSAPVTSTPATIPAITTSTSIPNYFANNNFSKVSTSVFDYNNLNPFDASHTFKNQSATNFTFSLTTSTSKTQPKYTTSKSNYEEQGKVAKKLPVVATTSEASANANKLPFSTITSTTKQQFPQYIPNSKYYATDTTITNYPKYQPASNMVQKTTTKTKSIQNPHNNSIQSAQLSHHQQQQPVQQQQQFSSKYDINWMTSSDFKPTTSDFSSILPPIDFTQNLCSSIATPCCAISTITSTTATSITTNNTYYPNFDLNRKSDIFFAHPPGEENLPWSPNKLSNILDTPHLSSTNHYFPATLQHLEGDLALHTNVVPPPASSLIGTNGKKCDLNKIWNQNIFNRDSTTNTSKKTNKASTTPATTAETVTNTTTLTNNTNFLSVRQLVESNEKNYSHNTTKMISNDKHFNETKTMKTKESPKKSSISVSSNLFTHNIVNEPANQPNTHGPTGIPNIYSAESLIGNTSTKKNDKPYNSDGYNYLAPTVTDSTSVISAVPNIFSNLDFVNDQTYSSNYPSSTRYNNQNYVTSFVDNNTSSSYPSYHSATNQLNPTFPPPLPPPLSSSSSVNVSSHNQNSYQIPSPQSFPKTQNSTNQFYLHTNHDITSFSSSYLQSNETGSNIAHRSKTIQPQKYPQNQAQVQQQLPEQLPIQHTQSAMVQKPRKSTSKSTVPSSATEGISTSINNYHHSHNIQNSSNNLLTYDFPAPVVSPASYFSVPMGINSPSSTLLSTSSALSINNNNGTTDNQHTHQQQSHHHLQQTPYNYHNFNYSTTPMKNATFNGIAPPPPPPLSSTTATSHHTQHSHHSQQNPLQLHPIGNHNSNNQSGSQTLTNFNLSTICPEINNSDKVRQTNW